MIAHRFCCLHIYAYYKERSVYTIRLPMCTQAKAVSRHQKETYLSIIRRFDILYCKSDI